MVLDYKKLAGDVCISSAAADAATAVWSPDPAALADAARSSKLATSSSACLRMSLDVW